MSVKKLIRNTLRKYNYDIVYYHPALDIPLRIKKLMASYKINKILDVGANVGNYGVDMRTNGYSNELISFEPMKKAFEQLKSKADGDAKWKIQHFALGDKNEISEINISENSLSSSINEMLPQHENSAPESKYIGTEEIQVKTLDSIFDEICSKDDNIFLKIDTQGFEKNVLEGAEKSLEYIDTVQVEMSLTPLYKNETLYTDLIDLLSKKGYSLVHVEHVFSDPETGRLLQVDGIFHRYKK